jgi:hypothetical protein
MVKQIPRFARNDKKQIPRHARNDKILCAGILDLA